MDNIEVPGFVYEFLNTEKDSKPLFNVVINFFFKFTIILYLPFHLQQNQHTRFIIAAGFSSREEQQAR